MNSGTSYTAACASGYTARSSSLVFFFGGGCGVPRLTAVVAAKIAPRLATAVEEVDYEFVYSYSNATKKNQYPKTI